MTNQPTNAVARLIGDDQLLLANAITHSLRGRIARRVSRRVSSVSETHRDRGAVSLEQVLWFVAAGVAVAVIAAILWSKIKTEANRPISTPSAP
jgi:hypothetical protein